MDRFRGYQLSLDLTPTHWALFWHREPGEISLYIGPFSFGVFWRLAA